MGTYPCLEGSLILEGLDASTIRDHLAAVMRAASVMTDRLYLAMAAASMAPGPRSPRLWNKPLPPMRET